MQISLSSLVLLLFLSFFGSHQASKKTRKTYEIEDGEIVFANPKFKVARIGKGSEDEFKFDFFEDQPKAYEENQSKRLREQAAGALYYCNETKLDWLIGQDYDFFSTGVWEEVLLKRKYSGIKYLLLNHFFDKETRRKTYYDAIENGATSLVRFFLNNFKGALKKNHGRFFHLACEHKRYKILRMMASEGFSANHVIPLKKGRYQLHEAVMESDVKLVKILLLFKDIEVNTNDSYGNTPLHYASNIEIVELLLDYDADPFQINVSGYDAITYAANAHMPNELIQAMLPNIKARLDHFITHCNLTIPDFQRTFIINRERTLEDSFYLASREPGWYNKASSFEINFDGENGVDRGGLTREWISLLIERFFVPRLPEEIESTVQSDEDQDPSNSSDSLISYESSESSDFFNSSSSSSGPGVVRQSGQMSSDSDNLEQVFINVGQMSSDSDDLEQVFINESDSSDSSDRSEDNGDNTHRRTILPSDSDSEDEVEEFNITDYMVDPEEFIPIYESTIKSVPVENVVLYYNAPFECVDAENKLYRISSKFTGPVEVYKFIGSIVAKSVIERIPLKVKLVPSLIKLVLGETLTFEDLREDDAVMYKSMLACLEPEFNFDTAFYTLPSDESVSVTAENVMTFLDETAVESMYLRQKDQIDQFVLGFRAIIDHRKLRSYFTPLVIQDILKGSDKINRTELYGSIEIFGNYWIDNRQLFWNAMDLLQDGELIEFVRFITGINGLPFGGVTALNKKIKVFDEITFSVPKASTCNYHLNLPVSITTVPDLVQMFRIAISSEPEFTEGCC